MRISLRQLSFRTMHWEAEVFVGARSQRPERIYSIDCQVIDGKLVPVSMCFAGHGNTPDRTYPFTDIAAVQEFLPELLARIATAFPDSIAEELERSKE